MSFEPMTHAFIVGFFTCLMTVFPIALLLLIPHDGWGRYLPSNHTHKLESEIVRLQRKIDELEGKAILESKV